MRRGVGPSFVLVLVMAGCNPGLPDADSEAYREVVSSYYTGLAAIQSGSDAGAEERLLRVTELAPAEPAAWANLGLLALRRNEYAAAAQYLERAQTLAPDNTDIAMLVGLQARAEGREADALAAYRRALMLDSTNVKAAFALAQGLEATPGQEAERAALLDHILRLQPDNLAVLVERARLAATAGDPAALAAALAALAPYAPDWPAAGQDQWAALQDAADDPAQAATAIAFLKNVLLRVTAYRQSLQAVQTPIEVVAELLPRFLSLENPRAQAAPPDDSLAFFPEPRPTPGGPWAALYALPGLESGKPVLVTAQAGEVRVDDATRLRYPGSQPLPHGYVTLDYDYDFVMDVALAGAEGVRLYRQDTTGAFQDVTAAMRLAPGITAAAYTGVWAADLDLEGDVDLILARAAAPPLVLRNNGDQTFAPIEPFDTPGLAGFDWADLDADGDPDAALLDANGAIHVYENLRGRFRQMANLTPAQPALALTLADADADGQMELLVMQADGQVVMAKRNVGANTWTFTALVPTSDVATAQTPGTPRLRMVDFDNNGALDLLITTPDAAHAWLGDGQGGWNASVPPVPIHASVVGDVNDDGRLDLSGLDADGAVVVAVNRGTKPYHWKELLPRSASTSGDQRINSFGIGGEIEMRAGLLFQKQPIREPLVHFGLGENLVADVARIIWPNGAVQAEFDLLSGQVVSMQQRLKGSCPWLFTYDGEGMTFVTDFIWRSPLGLRINAQETAGVMTTEDWVKIRGDQLVPKDGAYELRITAELWETHFFDHVSLLVVDHPADREVFVDERFVFPPPPFVVQPMTPPQPIARAVDERGRDVTALVEAKDDRYLDTFSPGVYQGVAEDHFVEITLGDGVPTDGPLRLLGYGWIRPTDSSINVALGQGGRPSPQGLRLEVPDGRGGWRIAYPDLGFPAGKNKTVVIDLEGLLPAGEAAQVRLHTNLEIYWDAFWWSTAAPGTELRQQRLLPQAADLRYRGFSAVHEANRASPELPAYHELAGTAPRWRDLEGYYTRFGDVRPLLEGVDDRYVIMNAGDELVFRFPAPEAPPAGWTRDFFLIGDGWVKDGDYNTSFSKTVLPLPSHGQPRYDTPPTTLEGDPVYQRHASDWQHYHTRYVSPKRFHFALN